MKRTSGASSSSSRCSIPCTAASSRSSSPRPPDSAAAKEDSSPRTGWSGRAGRAGTALPRITPAIVAWIPEWWSASAELAHDELALDLHPDDEEEQGHEPVVDELEEREPQRGGARAERDGESQDRPVALVREVRPRERHGGAAEEDEAARRLQAEERLDGPRHGL
jgi:hypothetical protein